MSRCVPFPPPGYVWSIDGNDLVELLKIRNKHFEVEKDKKREKERAKSMKKKRADKKKTKYETSSKNTTTKKEKCDLSDQFKQLIEYWKPPTMDGKSFDVGSDDEWWRSSSKSPKNSSCNNAMKSETSNNDVPEKIPEVTTRAVFLPKINTYALPYVVII